MVSNTRRVVTWLVLILSSIVMQRQKQMHGFFAALRMTDVKQAAAKANTEILNFVQNDEPKQTRANAEADSLRE